MLPCVLRMREQMDAYSPMEQQVAGFVVEAPYQVSEMSIEELANACNTSVSSVVRLCKSSGYSGYKEFLRVLSTDIALEQSRDITYEDLQPGSNLESIFIRAARCNIQAIENTLAILDEEEMEKAVRILAEAKRVDFYGIGTSGLVALDANNKFLRMGKLSMASADPHQQILTSVTLGKDDAVLLVSYSGDTKDMLELAGLIKRTGATMISLTRYSTNELSNLADVRLYCSASEQLVRSGPKGSRISAMTVIDMLYTAVASQMYSEVKQHLDKTHLITSRKHQKGIPTPE